LWDAVSGGVQVGSTQTVNNVGVANGRFTITLNADNEFGVDAFTGQERWLQIAVRCPAGTGSYTTLQPRQSLTAAPYAQSLLPGATISGSVGTNTNAMLSLSNFDPNGVSLRVFDTGLDGVFVDRAGRDGVYVGAAQQDGFFICSTGDQTGCTPQETANGLEIGRAQDNGLAIGNAGQNGVEVISSVNAFWARNVSADGLYVQSAGYIGVDVSGDNLAGYFNGAVQINGGCTGCLLANFGINTGQTELQPGDVVILTGSQISLVDSTPMLMEVSQANGTGAVVGVVMGRAEEVTVENPRPDELGKRLIPREGAVQPGEFVTIATYGLAPVRVNALSAPLAVGQRLAAGANGVARALQTVEVNGVTVNEAAPILGMALEAGDTDGDGLVWVLVNPQ
jgi:hypothetical protein